MKNINVQKPCIRTTILMIITTLALLLTIFVPNVKNVFAESKINKVLFLVNSQDDYDGILDWQNEGAEINGNLYGSDLFEIRLMGGAEITNLSSYIAVALPYSAENNYSRIKSIFNNGTYVYLYGSLSINDYKDVVGLQDFSLNVNINTVGLQGFSLDENINDSNTNANTQVKQYFEKEYEEEDVFNVIGYSNKALLCKISDETIAICTYLFNVVQNFELLIQPVPFATIIKSEFDFTTSWTFTGSPSPNQVQCIAHMQYTLYRNYDEQDPTYDYFGIITKTWVTMSAPIAKVRKVNTKYILPDASDHLLETGPASQNYIGNLNVNIGFGLTGPTGSIGFSIDLSNVNPDINRTVDYVNGIVEWKMQDAYVFWAPFLGTTPLDCVATWASAGNEAAIDVYFQGGADNPSSLYMSNYARIPIRFSYDEPSDIHSYTPGIIDGATYYLRNVKHGTYLDVDDQKTASGTPISTYSFHGQFNQKFVFKYLGMDLYEIEPIYTPGIILNIDTNSEGARLNIRTKSRSTTNQKFRAIHSSSGKIILYSEISNFSSALCFNFNAVVQKNYANLSSANKGYAEWILERADSSYDSYYTYYIKNVNTGLYLDVLGIATTNNSTIQTCPLNGGENQIWKKVYCPTTGEWMFKPMHRTDMAMDAYADNLVIYNDTYPTDQSFRLEAVGNAYRIKSRQSNYTKYLNVGGPIGAPHGSYVTTDNNANDLWMFVLI